MRKISSTTRSGQGDRGSYGGRARKGPFWPHSPSYEISIFQLMFIFAPQRRYTNDDDGVGGNFRKKACTESNIFGRYCEA